MAQLDKLDGNFLSSLSNGHSLESLIGAPLTAVTKANAMMLSSQAKFILDYCFTEKNGCFSPVLIKMEYSSGNGKEFFYIPLLSLLPVNNLAVDKVDVKFNVEITSMKKNMPNIASQNEVNDKANQKKTDISARISSTNKNGNEKTQSSSGISVQLKAKQIPLPKGMTSIIEMYSKNIITSQE